MKAFDATNLQRIVEDGHLFDYSPMTRQMLIGLADGLYSMTLDNLSLVKLVDKSNLDNGMYGASAYWLAGGSRAAFIARNHQLAVVNDDGTGLFQITPSDV